MVLNKFSKGSCSIFECSNKECSSKWKREKDGQYKLTAKHTHPPETKDVRDRRALKEEALARAARAAEAALARAARAAHAGTPDEQPSTSNRNDARRGKNNLAIIDKNHCLLKSVTFRSHRRKPGPGIGVTRGK